MGLTSCQDYEAGFTAADIFKGTYARKFVEKHGAIDPEETWDLSTAGGRRSVGSATRAAGTYTSVASADGYYYLPDEQLNWMKKELPESTNNSSKMQPFEMFWEKGNVFEVIPIYEGFAELRWRLHIQVMSADGSRELYNKIFWTKPNNNGSDKFEVIWEAEPTIASDNEISVFYQTTASEARIWAWGGGVKGFPEGGWDNRPYMTCIGSNGLGNHVFKYTFSGSNEPTHVKFDDHDLTFVNHGYYYAGGTASANTITAKSKSSTNWKPFANNSDGAYAAQFRSKPELSTTFLGGNDFPTGSKVLFYLKIIGGGKDGTPDGKMQFSDQKQMTLLECPRPLNIPKDYKTYILGVEDETITSNTCDKDYNDIVFLIAGKVPDPVYYKHDPYVKVTEKRYMCEDLTDTGDFDFNDIVIDVRQTYTKYFRETTDRDVYEVDHDETKQEAKVYWLCGTVPIKAQVGNYEFPLITNPSDQAQSKAQLNINSSNYNYNEGKWFSGTGTTSGYHPMGDDDWVTITGWDPDANNISIYVCWDGSKATTLENATSIDGGSKVWKSTFPEKPGMVPYIIATDRSDEPSAENVDIVDSSWYQDHFRLWSSPTAKPSSTDKQ